MVHKYRNGKLCHLIRWANLVPPSHILSLVDPVGALYQHSWLADWRVDGGDSVVGKGRVNEDIGRDEEGADEDDEGKDNKGSGRAEVGRAKRNVTDSFSYRSIAAARNCNLSGWRITCWISLLNLCNITR